VEYALEVKDRIITLIETAHPAEFRRTFRSPIGFMALSETDSPALSVSVVSHDDRIRAGGSVNRRTVTVICEVQIAVAGWDEAGRLEDMLVRLCGGVACTLQEHLNDSLWPLGGGILDPGVRYHLVGQGDQIFTQVGAIRWEAMKSAR
jgi:hypothetical protein